jgi:hypothetical protein
MMFEERWRVRRRERARYNVPFSIDDAVLKANVVIKYYY